MFGRKSECLGESECGRETVGERAGKRECVLGKVCERETVCVGERV